MTPAQALAYAATYAHGQQTLALLIGRRVREAWSALSG